MTVTFKHRDCYTSAGLRKRYYTSKRDAKEARRSALSQGKNLEVYRCSRCDLWHLGNRRRRRRSA